eukprot:6173476-Pleurochrysis_carterae.AAC.1
MRCGSRSHATAFRAGRLRRTFMHVTNSHAASNQILSDRRIGRCPLYCWKFSRNRGTLTTLLAEGHKEPWRRTALRRNALTARSKGAHALLAPKRLNARNEREGAYVSHAVFTCRRSKGYADGNLDGAPSSNGLALVHHRRWSRH